MHCKDLLYSLRLLNQTIITVCLFGGIHHGANLNYGLPSKLKLQFDHGANLNYCLVMEQIYIMIWSWSKLIS